METNKQNGSNRVTMRRSDYVGPAVSGRDTVAARLRMRDSPVPQKATLLQHRRFGHYVISKHVKLRYQHGRESIFGRYSMQVSRITRNSIVGTSWATYGIYLKPSHYTGVSRWIYRFAVVVALLILAMPVVEPLFDMKVNSSRYTLTSNVTKLIGPANQNLTDNFTYDASTSSYYYNQKGITSSGDPAQSMKAELGGNGKNNPSLYSVKFATDPSKGITYYDNNLDVSFTMIPEFKVLGMSEQGGRMVYSLPGGSQIAYTPKNNGLKEDLILNQFLGSTQTYQYKLVVPNTLSAQIIPNSAGEVGIYSADPALYGNISYGSSSDESSVMQGRINSPKTNLVFIVPAPNVKQDSTKQSSVIGATSQLSGDLFTLDVSHLPSTGYPLDIDPSVVVSGATSFSTGNIDSNNIAYTTGVNRSGLTGGGVSAGWTSQTALSQALSAASSVVYNGYVYELGGANSSNVAQTTTYYAPLNSGGVIGSWTATTALPIAVSSATSIVYNGYVYELGGFNGTTYYSNVYYAPLNANGTIGTWTSTTALPQAMIGSSTITYNGYVYELGGYQAAGTTLAATYYAPLNANGTIGTWTSTTALPQANRAAPLVAYNGYVYELGGNNGTSYFATTYYAPLNSNGTIGTWATTTALPQSFYKDTALIYSGYVYVMGGYNGTYYATVYYAPLNANGTIGTWTSTTALPGVTDFATSVVYNGYVYELGGLNGSGVSQSTTYSALIDPAGSLSNYTGTTSLPNGLYSAATVVNNGYIYEIGGWNNSAVQSATYYAPLNSNGTIGTWTSTTALPIALRYVSSTVYNGYVYELGGLNSSSAVQSATYYAPLNSNGTIGTWTSTTALPIALEFTGVLANNGYIYSIGGNTGSASATTYYAPLNSNGTIGTWATTTALPSGNYGSNPVIWGGYVYEIGGISGSSASATTYYAPLNSNGTIGAWNTSTSLPQAIELAGIVVDNGYVYAIAGQNGSSYLTTTYYAPLNSNGTIGTWATTTALPTTSSMMGAVTYDGYLYEVGGQNSSGTNLTNTYYAQINNGGAGTATAWSNQGALPTSVYGPTSAVYNGYIYLLGGSTATVQATVYYASLSSTGTIGTWNTTTALPQAMFRSTTIIYNNYIYEIGGYNSSSTPITNTYYAPINSNGTIGTWTATTSMPIAVYSAGSAVYNGYVYELGGAISSNVQQTGTYYAPLNSNGTIGTWTSTTALPTPLQFASTVENNGYIYELGGISTGSTPQSATYYAPLNSNGTIGTWTATTSLPATLYATTALVEDGYVYILGGSNGTTQVSTVYYAPLNSNGTIGSWDQTTSLGQGLSSATAQVYNGYVYQLAGYYNNAAYNTEYYSSLNTMARIGQYSDVVNLGSNYDVTGISYTGLLPTTLYAGTPNALQYETALSSGVFSTANPALSTLTGGACTQGGTSAQYVWISATLDDSNESVFPDLAATNSANLTSVTITYSASHPLPSQRMRLGQTLQTGVLSQLDTCYP
jgi:N-acetylneuraminic acid mutarotase